MIVNSTAVFPLTANHSIHTVAAFPALLLLARLKAGSCFIRRGSDFEEARSVAGVNWIDGTRNTKLA